MNKKLIISLLLAVTLIIMGRIIWLVKNKQISQTEKPAMEKLIKENIPTSSENKKSFDTKPPAATQYIINDPNLEIPHSTNFELDKESLISYPDGAVFNANICQKNNKDACINLTVYDFNKACKNQEQYDIAFYQENNAMLLECQKIKAEDEKSVSTIYHATQNKEDFILLQAGKITDYEKKLAKNLCTTSCPTIISSNKITNSTLNGTETIEKFKNPLEGDTTKSIHATFFKEGIFYRFSLGEIKNEEDESINNYREFIRLIKFK